MHILIISLGPIQDFIAAARRCRDLWYGSWLLSDLSKAAALGVAIRIGQQHLVFPSPETHLHETVEGKDETSVANKIVVLVPDGVDPNVVAEAAEKNMRERLASRAQAVFEAIEDGQKAFGQKRSLQREMAEQQIEDLIEFLWVAAPIKEDGYGAARERAESLVAQRKRTMLWGRVPWSPLPGVPKSSLDGQRESVIREDLFVFVKDKPEYEGRLRRVYGVKKNERLCGVGLLKRLGKRKKGDKDHQFLSTPHLATGPLLQRMEKEANERADALRLAWNQYLEKLQNYGAVLEETAAKPHSVLGHYDGMLLIDTRLEEWFEHQTEGDRKKSVIAAREALCTFYRETKLPPPRPYFAVLLADGDKMGNSIKHCKDVHRHRDLSLQLDKFAQHARTVVEDNHKGELIYSGGDDVLAFVPLNRVIECARALASDFAEKLKDFKGDDDKSPTLSVGVAICHFIEPMGHALELARKAEKRAKIKRNSLAIFVDKRSGPPVEVVDEWTFKDGKEFHEQLLHLVGLHRRDEIPDGVAHELLELESLRERSDKNDKQHQETLTKLIAVEANRILKRKRAKGGTTALGEDLIEELLETPQQLAERLLVTSLIAKAKDIAEGKLQKNNEAADKPTEAHENLAH